MEYKLKEIDYTEGCGKCGEDLENTHPQAVATEITAYPGNKGNTYPICRNCYENHDPGKDN